MDIKVDPVFPKPVPVVPEKVTIEMSIEDAKILRALLGQSSGPELLHKLQSPTNITPVNVDDVVLGNWLTRFSGMILVALNSRG